MAPIYGIYSKEACLREFAVLHTKHQKKNEHKN